LRDIVEKAVIAIACKAFPNSLFFELQSNIVLQELCLNEKNYLKFYELDEALHKIIFVGCKKARTWSMIQQMNTHYNRVRMLNIAGGYDALPVLNQHRQLVRAILEKDVALGTQTIELHLDKVKFDIADLCQDYADYFKPTNKL